jgi:hypothetical protein
MLKLWFDLNAEKYGIVYEMPIKLRIFISVLYFSISLDFCKIIVGSRELLHIVFSEILRCLFACKN